jgi:hypothetical protein
MSAKAKKIIPINDQRDLVSESSMEQFQGRESKELIIGFIGPIGCGLAKVISGAEQILQSMGYKVVRIKISNLLDEEIDGVVVPLASTRALVLLFVDTTDFKMRVKSCA